jgi:signal peptidase II
MKLSKSQKLIIIAFVLIAFDQITKVLVKTNMFIGESIPVFGNWFQILFVENKGMAFGMEFGGNIGKFLLTLIRIVLVGFIFIYIRRLLKKEAPMGVLVGLTLILVGAFGNIIDCLFYGLLFGPSSYMQVAQFLPEGGGYAPFFFGKVVDMLYFPVIDTLWPSWVPWVGGKELVFFRPIFNVADSCITVGALYLLIFKWKFFSKENK